VRRGDFVEFESRNDIDDLTSSLEPNRVFTVDEDPSSLHRRTPTGVTFTAKELRE